jgi:predicted DsbA family dithiol-disulfide isomerase
MSLKVHIWSDIVCPWCYVGKRRFEKAVAEFGEPVEVQWHSFELDPTRGDRGSLGYVERLAKKYRMPQERAQGMIDTMVITGNNEGISFDFSRAVPASSFDAHRLTHLALAHSLQDALKERLFRAHFCEGIAMDDHAELTRLAVEVGLDADEVAAVLASTQYADDVQADKEEAQSLGVTGVPFFVIGSYGVAGAQTPEKLLQVLDRAYTEEGESDPENAGEALDQVCGPELC